MKKFNGYSLLLHNTFGLDIQTRYFIEYDSVEDLQKLIASHPCKPLLHIGEGSNLLFTKNFEGTVLHSHITEIDVISETDETVCLQVGSGVNWDNFVAYTVNKGYCGLENLSLIPGEVGASAVQNIGAYGAEVNNSIEKVEVVNLETGEIETKCHDDCAYSYRYSNFKGPWRGRYAVTHVVFRLNKKFIPNLEYAPVRAFAEEMGLENLTGQAVRNRIIEIRQNKLPDPKVLGNAGSFFMNPIVSVEMFNNLVKQYPSMPHYDMANGVKVPAGWLIEQCGWKGRALGRAAIYEKQALVIVNLGGATAQDIINLSNQVCNDVRRKFGIEIKPEVNWI